MGMGGIGKAQTKFNLRVGGEYRQVWLSSMFPFPLLSGHLILPLLGLQPTQCFPSIYIALVVGILCLSI